MSKPLTVNQLVDLDRYIKRYLKALDNHQPYVMIVYPDPHILNGEAILLEAGITNETKSGVDMISNMPPDKIKEVIIFTAIEIQESDKSKTR